MKYAGLSCAAYTQSGFYTLTYTHARIHAQGLDTHPTGQRLRMHPYCLRMRNVEVCALYGGVPCANLCPSPTAEGEPLPVVHVPSTPDNQPHSMERDFIFVERPSQDFFCPVSLELLLERDFIFIFPGWRSPCGKN